MSLQDNIFTEEVENDITLFSADARRKRVLVFPPVNNYRRFLIHQLVQDRFSGLKTFSIGQGFARRTVVCYESDILSNSKLNGVLSSATCTEHGDSFPLVTKRGAMRVEESRRSSDDSTSPEHSRMRQVKTSPAVEIYRPPAARRANKDGQVSPAVPMASESSCASAKANRQRRPDRAVYVPKHRRNTETEESVQQPDEIISPRPRCNRARTSSPCLENEPFRKQFSPHERNESGGSWDKRVSLESCEKSEETDYCSRSSEDAGGPSKSTNSKENSELIVNKEVRTLENYREKDDTITRLERDSEESSSSSHSFEVIDDPVTTKYKEEENVEEVDSRMKSDLTLQNESSSSSDTVDKSCNRSDPVDRNEETNNKNLRAANSCIVSNVLIISDPKEREPEKKMSNIEKENTATVTPPEKKPKKVARVKSKPASPPSPPIKVNRDECDWDSLFDDNGECLDPILIEELTVAVGEVTIEQPKNDYKSFSRPVEVSSDEFAHVVEIYNFPSDFKTSDLAAVFSPWKNGGFELKWVDDTHCLGVFSSPLVAAEVLGSDHPFVKTRPLSAATSLSKTKARKSVEFLQPYKTRPQTCAALARRLVTGALGVKLATARQEREQEKLLLREAKEKRRLANQQREDVWEGIIAKK